MFHDLKTLPKFRQERREATLATAEAVMRKEVTPLLGALNGLEKKNFFCVCFALASSISDTNYTIGVEATYAPNPHLTLKQPEKFRYNGSASTQKWVQWQNKKGLTDFRSEIFNWAAQVAPEQVPEIKAALRKIEMQR